MHEQLRSVGLDVGTTTTQLIVSELTVENQAGSFSVPDLAISHRRILYQSPVHFTPLAGESLVDGDAIRQIVDAEYKQAGITRNSVDTGAIIITGETSRKENAQAVLEALSDFAGDFVVATAGPDLESILAARGAGAVDHSEKTGQTVLHMDIGGGTSNLALIEDGRITRTGCLNIGGRLVKLDHDGTVLYVSPVLSGLTDLTVHLRASGQQIEQLAKLLTSALEMAAGLRPPTDLLERLRTKETDVPWVPPATNVTISFSGGVADCINHPHEPRTFGDIGPALGQAIGSSRLCQENYLLGEQTIRATVIGAGCHSTQLSGSTVYYRNITFPLKNLPVVIIPADQPEQLPARLSGQDTTPVLALEGTVPQDYTHIRVLADRLARHIPLGPVYLAARQDMAKALGQALALRLPPDRPILCLDRLQLQEGSYLDVGAPIGPALPVVIKTLVLSNK